MDREELYDDVYWEDVNNKANIFEPNAFEKAAESLQKISKGWQRAENYEPNAEPDEVNHPSRYLHNGIETIDVIKAWTEGLDGAYAFCIGNAIKYLSRWQEKGGIEDLKKAVWYIQWVIDNG